MSKREHTPKPWYVLDMRDTVGELCIVADDEHGTLVLAHIECDGHAVGDANDMRMALIMAAGQDLLAVVQALVKAPQGCDCQPGPGCTRAALRQRAKETVRKATEVPSESH